MTEGQVYPEPAEVSMNFLLGLLIGNVTGIFLWELGKVALKKIRGLGGGPQA